MPPLTLFLPNLLYTTADFLCYSVKRATGVAGVGGGSEEGWWLLEEFRNASSHTHAHTPYKDFISLSDCLHFSRPKQAQKCQHYFFYGGGGQLAWHKKISKPLPCIKK